MPDTSRISKRGGNNSHSKKPMETATTPQEHRPSQTQSIAPLLLSVAVAARSLGLSRAKLYAMIDRKEIPAVRIGRAIRLSVSTLEAWVREREQEQNPPPEEHPSPWRGSRPFR